MGYIGVFGPQKLRKLGNIGNVGGGMDVWTAAIA